MKSRFFMIVTPLMILMFCGLGASAVIGATAPVYNAAELTNRLKTGTYLQKTDNLMVIVDGQGETFLGVGQTQNQKIARYLIANIGKTIPNIPHRRMLRVFGPKATSFEKDFSTIFGLYHINATGFRPIIATKTLAISDFDPLGMTFLAASNEFAKLSGSHAIILISNGVHIPQSAIHEAAYLKKKFGGSVCYYPILTGNNPEGAAKMKAIAKVGVCGFLARYDEVDSPAEMTNYVEKIFFSKRRLPAPVVEPEPVAVQEPLEPEPVIVEEEIIEEVVEEPVVQEDEVIILERQLPHDKVVTIELHVEFDLDKATLRPGYQEEINQVADFMLRYPETEALLEGHTCNLGSEAYNKDLSNRRAQTVKDYLVDTFAIDPGRIKTRGAGENEPIADNSTEEGRMKNRRVVAVISTIVTDYVTVEQEVLKSDFLREDFVMPPVEEEVDEMLMEQEEPQDSSPAPGADAAPQPAEDEATPMTSADEQEETDAEATPEEGAAAVKEDLSLDLLEPVEQEDAVEAPADEPGEAAAPATYEEEEADTMTAPVSESEPEEERSSGAMQQDDLADGEAAPPELMEDAEIDAIFEESAGDSQKEPVDSVGNETEAEAATTATAAEEATSSPEESGAASGSDALTGEAPTVEDVVVVSPGESAFDEEKAPLQVEPVEEEESKKEVGGEEDSML